MEGEVSESASVWARRMEKGSHEFVVENYSLRRKGISGVNRPIESDQFVVGGHRWTIRFYPDGKKVAAYNDGYASLYICVKGESVEPVEFLSELYILDQSGKGNHLGMSTFEDYESYKEVQSLTCGLMSGNLHFISRRFLESPDYLKDDCLKIRGTVGVFIYHIQNQPLMEVLEADFGKQLESKQWADEYIFFKVANETFCANKLMLAVCCPGLLSCLSNVHQTRDIVIPDMEPRIFKAMLWFIYTETLPGEEQEAFTDSGAPMLKSFMAKMLAAADQFELKRLKEICESRMVEKISGESVGYLLHLADLYHAIKLKVACLRFAGENQAVVLESDGSEYLRETCPLLFLELAGFKENCSNRSTRGEGVLGFCSKIISGVKESFGSTFGPLKHKIKEF